MFNQTTPQDYLNDLHAIRIPALFEPRINARDRATGIRNAKKELGRLKVELQHHRDSLRSKNKKSADDELTRILAPYNLLQNLIQQLTAEVSKLEDILASGKLLPHGFEFGEYIFGDEEKGEWFVGNQGDYDEWMEAEQVKLRLDGFHDTGEPLRQRLAKIQNDFADMKAVYQKAQKKLDRQHKRGYIFRRILLLLLFTIGAGGVGGYLYFVENVQLGLIGLGLGMFFFLLIPFAYSDWKKRNTKLVGSVRELKTQLRRLQLEGKDIQKQYRPIEFQIKSLQQEYSRLRAGLSGGKQDTSVA